MAKAILFLILSIVFVLCFVSVISIDQKKYSLCLNDLNNTTKQEEGTIVLPSSTTNFTGEICELNIENHENDKIELRLVSVTTICSPTTTNSYIKIYDENMKLQRTYCLIEEPKAKEEYIVLRSTVINVLYKASQVNEVEPVQTNSVVIKYRRMKSKTRKLCQYVFGGANGTFQSSGYPSYAHNVDCEWRIETEKGKHVSLDFIKLSFSDGVSLDSVDCEKNFVEVRDGHDQKAPVLAKFCVTQQPRAIQSKTSHLLVRIKSTIDTGIRLKATYTTTRSCLLGHGTQIYPPAVGYCKEWHLTALQPGMTAALSFTGMHLKSTDRHSCSGNVVEVWDGEHTNVYCNSNYPPKIIISQHGTLKVTYRSVKYRGTSNHFEGSFTSLLPESYNSKCYVENKALHFRCDDHKTIPCDFLCDGAIQCRDNSDENTCPKMKARWKKLQVFVIIMGSVCASTIIFCVGLVCFRKYILRSGQLTDSHGRRCSTTSDLAPLTPHTDLPSPPPRYFSDNENTPPLIIRGTYFFGNEFSQSGIHNASLFGIPPPRYRSTESVGQQPQLEDEWSSIPLLPTDFTGELLPTGDPPEYHSPVVLKDEKPTGQSTNEPNVGTTTDQTTDTPNINTDGINTPTDTSNTNNPNLSCTFMYV